VSTDASFIPTSPASDPDLPTDLAACHALILQLLNDQKQKSLAIERLEYKVQDLLRRLYGRSSEKIDPRQLTLFAGLLDQLKEEAPAESEPAPPPVKTTPPKGHGRRKLPANLPRKRIVHDLPEAEKPCPGCGEPRQVIGQEVSEQLDYEPAKLTVIEHVRLKYACRSCEAQAESPQIVTAEKPLMPIEKGLAAPGLLSYVMVSKYGDHLPLHRLERILERHGIEIARSTMCDWAAQSAAALKPLYDLMITEVLASRIIHTDDTPVDVLDRRLPTTRTGRFWVYLGEAAHPQTVFTYTPTRSRDGPRTFLAGWGQGERRYLQADAFGGYDGIYAGEVGGRIIEVACWAHARRRFHKAQKSDGAASARALAYIRLLYDVEDEAKPLSPAERARLRQAKALPRLQQFKAWLESQQAVRGGPVLPKSPMGEAIHYVLNQWEALTVYVTDGELAIDNNTAERALRRVAIGRKNWLFCGSDNGGATAAVLFSLMATCQRHKVDPFAYLRDVLTRIAAHPMNRLADLLPDRWTPAHLTASAEPSPATIQTTLES
jgi:transposase